MRRSEEGNLLWFVSHNLVSHNLVSHNGRKGYKGNKEKSYER